VLTGSLGDGPAGRAAASERRRADAVVGEYVVDLAGADEERLEDALGIAGLTEHVFERLCTPGTFEACLSRPTFPAVRGCCEAK